MKEMSGSKEVLKNFHQIVVFIGPEGSGKTTQALSLAKETGMPYISTGDLIRHLAAHDFESKYGELCRDMQARHAYLDGETLLEILTRRLSEADTAGGFILDGGLRTVEETERFSDCLTEAGRGNIPVKVVLLHIPEEVSLTRLVGVQGRNRKDDTEEGVLKRLTSYHHKLEQRLELIQNQENWRLVPVDATISEAETFTRVVEAILA